MNPVNLVLLAADYAGAPADLTGYRWLVAPAHTIALSVVAWVRAPSVYANDGADYPWTQVPVNVRLERDVEDQHGGVKFWVGWNTEARVGALWIEEV